jgi:hypothetical protein
MKDLLGKELFDEARYGTTPQHVEASKRRIKRAAWSLLVLGLAVLWMIFQAHR